MPTSNILLSPFSFDCIYSLIFLLRFEYSLGNDNVKYKFDVDINNYGNEIIGIKAKNDEEINTTDRLDVIEEQSDFITESSRLQFLMKLLHSNNEILSTEEINTRKQLISEYCSKWDLIHKTTV